VYKQDRIQNHISQAVFFAAVILIAGAFSTGCKKQPSEPSNQPDTQQALPKENVEKPSVSVSLKDLIATRKYWDTAFTSWYGKMAPDFTLTDISGKQHKLSGYRGKDVMIVFWATWCGPCIQEMPHLIELRKTVGQDKLAMLGISYITTKPPNTSEMIKNVAERRKINYTVIPVDESEMSAPYNQIRGIPCSFFIDPEGKIKLATLGVLSLDTMKAILQAE